MATNIEWATEVWNSVAGCTRVSEGCRNCYAETMTRRLAGTARADRRAGRKPGRKANYLGVLDKRGQWNGKVRCHEDALCIPLHWRKPRRIFVNSMSDLFHPKVPFEFIDKVFAVMALCPQHTFMVLTKWPERMAEYLSSNVPNHLVRGLKIGKAIDRLGYEIPNAAMPLPNVWLGTSVENQETADERIPHLRKCSAAVRFLSCEPLLGKLDLWLDSQLFVGMPDVDRPIHWLIAGGESGPGARPCNVKWHRSLRDQCRAAGVPFYYKQGGSSNRCEHDSKGACFQCIPQDLRIREFPNGT